jgi:hypothetical protein
MEAFRIFRQEQQKTTADAVQQLQVRNPGP